MKYIGTRHKTGPVRFVDALWHPQATDGGLYMPAAIPELPAPVLRNMSSMSVAEIAYVVFNAFLGGEFSASKIKQIVEDVYNFDIPIVRLDSSTYIAELFGGPTLAFKDFGARAMARLLRETSDREGAQPVNVMIATTGNTGSAVANALAGAKGINVFIVFPRGTATRALENQFTTPGGNIYPVEVSGSIDLCYELVSRALSDVELNSKFTMMSANSGNIARLIGQTVPWFYSVSRLIEMKNGNNGITVSVPAGNLGNLTAGLIAHRMGLKIDRIISCENANDYLRRAMKTSDFEPRTATPTLAYAADKSLPTNMERIFSLCNGDISVLEKYVTPVSVSDPDIISAINSCFERYNYLLDPHSAMAYAGLETNISPDDTGLVMATAHPAKSLTAMNAITGRHIELPLQLNRFMGRPDYRIRIRPVYSALRRVIMDANATENQNHQ